MSNQSKHLQKMFEDLGLKPDEELLFDVDDDNCTKASTPDSHKTFSQDDDENWSSGNLDDIDKYGFGTTPPRTERNRKQKERNAAYCNQAAEAAKSFISRGRHKVASRCASLPMHSSYSLIDNGNIPTNHMTRERKRTQERNHDRQSKALLSDFPPETNVITISDDSEPESVSETKCESLPPVSLAVKVMQRARYMSVSSRKIGTRGFGARKISTTDLPADRVSFYEMMTGFLRPSNPEQNSLLKNRSEEEVLYQQELNETIWLELQAWHSGQDVISHDKFLLEERQKVREVYEEIQNFNFRQTLINLMEKEKVSSNHLSVSMEERMGRCCELCFGEDWLGCLSVWCDWCRNNETLALSNVSQLLEKVETVISLFPSSRNLAQFFPPWTDEDFSNKYKALCLWYNTASQLRLVTELLGRRLGHISNDSIPWPVFPANDLKSPSHSLASRDSGHHSAEEVTPDKHVPVVRFEIDEPVSWTFSSDPSHSNESDFTSESDNDRSTDHLTPPPSAGELKRSTSHIFLEANPYGSYVENLLRNKGMKKTLDKVAEVIQDIMQKTVNVFEVENPPIKEPRIKVEGEAKLHVHPLAALQEELNRTKGWTKLFNSLGLPRFHGLYLFLASIPLHMIRECLKLRLEQMPSRPSKLSIQQLMGKYKEAIKFAVGVRQKYVKCCNILIPDLPCDLAKNLETRKTQAIEELDANVQKMLAVYLEWLDQFILMLHREPHVAGLQRNYLQEEWRFVQATCPYVTDGESLAATRFCNIACHMLCSVADFLDTGIDDMVSDQQDTDFDPGSSPDDDDVDSMEQENDRHKVAERCRALQELLTEAKQRSLRAIALAKMLRKDLEVAMEGSLIADFDVFIDYLYSLGHILVKGHSIDNVSIFVPGILANNIDEILRMLQMQIREPLMPTETVSDNYLLLVNCQDKEVNWMGSSVDVLLTAECAIMLSRVQISSVMLVTRNVCHLNYLRGKLANTLKDVVVISGEQIAPHEAVTYSLIEMKKEALELCKNLEKSIMQAENLVSASQISEGDEDRKQLCHLVRDSVHQGFLFGFEYHKEVLRIVSGRQRKELAPLLVNFGRSWIRFVKSHYSSGKGTRPRWASPGLDFLLFISDPHNTCHISDTEFKQLRIDVEEAREYIIGSLNNSSSSNPGTPVLTPKSLRSQLLRYGQQSIDKSIDENDGPRELPIERVRRGIIELEEQLDHEKPYLGRVSSCRRDLVEFKRHVVSFSWQRGRKIGSGRFGKVYSVVNNNTGESLAMKVLTLGGHKQAQIEEVADELNTFQHITHLHLVKYYGFEIYNDEMRIFMEYCEEGTLEALAARIEGLPEKIFRKYTRQLLLAVLALHERGIAHRDIKGANIFLANDGNILKLGDFGSAVRLKGAQTEVGEISGLVGTLAFMAPEIFHSNQGHGRAADLWSVGCVVIEMATGKRPWCEYDSSAPIMFKVGQGSSPQPPVSMSEEGHDFLQRCFQHNPKERATAQQLLDHSFVKFEEEFFPSFERQQSISFDRFL